MLIKGNNEDSARDVVGPNTSVAISRTRSIIMLNQCRHANHLSWKQLFIVPASV